MHIHQALREIKDIHQRIISSTYFYGYSAGARFTGGLMALLGAAVLAWIAAPDSPWIHFTGWGLVFVLAVAINYFFLCSKLHFSKENLLSSPVIEPLMLIITGGILTLTLAWHQQFNLLFGVWMSIFGFANIAAKKSFSREVALVGYFYILAGWIYLLAWPFQNFQNPWPMGLVFFGGEAAGGYAFYIHNQNEVPESEQH